MLQANTTLLHPTVLSHLQNAEKAINPPLDDYQTQCAKQMAGSTVQVITKAQVKFPILL